MNTNEENRKVVKDEWPKYWECKWLGCVRQLTKDSTPEYFVDKTWKPTSSKCIQDCDTPITPQRAFELTGDKSILEKGGENEASKLVKQWTEENNSLLASPAPEVTKEASIPRIYTRCPQCGNDTLTISNGHLLCTWHTCSNPTAIEQLASPPQWIPVSERLPEPNQPFVERFIIDDACKFLVKEKGVPNPSAFMGILNFWFPLPPPPQPKTREQEDEEAFRHWFKNDQGTDYGNIEEQSKRAYLQGRRDERKEK